METELLSFQGKQEIKDALITSLKKHRELDNFSQASDNFDKKKRKGSAVMCTLFSPDQFASGKVDTADIYGRCETELGISRVIASLEDKIFSGLPAGEFKNWPIDFIEAIPVGVDLENVWRKFMIWLLADDNCGWLNYVENEDIRNVIQKIAATYQLSLTETVPSETWSELRDIAVAAVDTAYNDGVDADIDDVEAAVDAAATGDDYAAGSYDQAAFGVVNAAYAAAARKRVSYSQMAQKLIELLKGA